MGNTSVRSFVVASSSCAGPSASRDCGVVHEPGGGKGKGKGEEKGEGRGAWATRLSGAVQLHLAVVQGHPAPMAAVLSCTNTHTSSTSPQILHTFPHSSSPSTRLLTPTSVTSACISSSHSSNTNVDRYAQRSDSDCTLWHCTSVNFSSRPCCRDSLQGGGQGTPHKCELLKPPMLQGQPVKCGTWHNAKE